LRCIFCKSDSASSRSVEHIIPESLGNKSHVLPKGVVCDACNNYFAREVERPFLDSPSMRVLRFHQALESKKGRLPPLSGIISPGVPAIVTRIPKYDFTSVAVPQDAFDQITQSPTGSLVLPIDGPLPTSRTISRFMAKVAVESMAARVVQYPESLEYLCDETQLDDIRDHARRGKIAGWPVHMRRIYATNARTSRENGEFEQVVHESDFLVTTSSEWYFVLVLFGQEFAINLGGPDIDGYRRWLKDNNDESPLYSGKNNGVYPQPRQRG